MSASAVNDNTLDMLTDLRKDLLDWLPLPTALMAYYALVFIERAIGTQPWPVVAVVMGVAISSLVAFYLRATRRRLAALVYVEGLASATLLLIGLSPLPFGIVLLPVVLLLNVATLGVRPMMAVAGLGIVAIVASTRQHGLPNYTVAGPIAAVTFTTAIAWLLYRHLISALEWAWSSYQQAHALAEEARQRRGELVRTLKALDEAYYRLERFSAQLAQAREIAEEAKRAKQQFVATVSHELRTPLNIIIGFAELMALSPESYGVRGVPRLFMGDINRIYRSAQHLKSLIDDVLDLSRIDAERMVLVSEQVALPEIIAEATDMVWSLVTQKGLQLSTNVPASLPLIPLDRLRIRQVLLNLMSNAVRFTDIGCITVTARLQGTEIQVTVADTGPGIAPEDLDKVFEEFHQLDAGLSRKQGGTGLGLALSRRFVELHGGRIWVESELDRGSRFHFTLPLVQAALPGELRSASLLVPSSIEAHAGRTLLVVTQEPMVVNLLRRHLRGYQVRGVLDEELPHAISTYLPHAVIKNGLFPSMAQTFAEGQLGSDDRPSAVPVLTCPLPDPTYLGRTLGVDRYLVKPVAREQLLSLLAGYGDVVQRVLIVDDDVQLAELIARIVRAAPGPHTVDVACGGEEGLAHMRECRPDLVLLDLVMQNVDGLTVLRLMRSDEHLQTVPIVIITAHDLPSEEARLPGRTYIAVKGSGSFTVTEVLNCVQALLDALPPPKPASLSPRARATNPPALLAF